MINKEINTEDNVEDVIRMLKIEEVLTSDSISNLPFESLDETDLIEDTYVDDEVDYDEINLENFM